MLGNKETVAPPADLEVDAVRDMTSTIQRNFDSLFEAAHVHSVRKTAPSEKEGSIGDIVLVELSGVPYVYFKFSTLGWKRILAS